MHIICEGLDNSGKSTLIDNLIKHYKLPFIKLHYYGPPFKDKEKDIKFDMKLYSEMASIFNSYENVIADRSHLGSLVYSPIYRGHNGEHVLEIEKYLPEDTILFTLVDEPENLISRDDGLSFSTDIEKKRQEIKAFKDAHDKSTIKNKYIINIEKFNAEEVTKIAVDYIENYVKGKKEIND
jgi:thymidylate kinase